MSNDLSYVGPEVVGCAIDDLVRFLFDKFAVRVVGICHARACLKHEIAKWRNSEMVRKIRAKLKRHNRIYFFTSGGEVLEDKNRNLRRADIAQAHVILYSQTQDKKECEFRICFSRYIT